MLLIYIDQTLESLDGCIKERAIEDTRKIKEIKRDKRRRKKKKLTVNKEKNIYIILIKSLDFD